MMFFLPGQGGHQHKQGGLRQVEIGDQSVNDLELVARIDEDVCPAAGWLFLTFHPLPRRIPVSGSWWCPTAMTRPPAAFVSLMSFAWSSSMKKYSECIWCWVTSSTFTGRKVPSPTCSVTWAIFTPFFSIWRSSSGVKCRPAVGAAAEPSCFA